MAKFCFRCFKRYFNPFVKRRDLVMSKEKFVCIGCGKTRKHVKCYKDK